MTLAPFSLGRRVGEGFAPLREEGRRRSQVLQVVESTILSAPIAALYLQGAIALFLILLGTLTRQGFSTMVDYTAPVFWFFFLLSGVSLFLLRQKDLDRVRPFRVPLHILTP